MGNAWYVSPFDHSWANPQNALGVGAPPGTRPGAAPSPDQVVAALAAFPEYHISVRQRERKGKGLAVQIEARRADGSYAIEIQLLRVTATDQPAGVFVFDYYHGTDELVRLVAELAAACGPLVLWHDSGGEPSILVTEPPSPSAPNPTHG